MNLRRRAVPHAQAAQVMTVDQVAEYLQLNRLTVYRYVREGRIPAARIGKLYRVLKADVDAFLEQQKTRVTAGAEVAKAPTASDEVRPQRSTTKPIQRSPQEIYVGPSWREMRREQETTRKPTYPIEWVIRGLH